MPNYVKNTLEISGQEKDIIEVLNRICDPEKGLGTIDFERIIPMPEELDVDNDECSMEFAIKCALFDDMDTLKLDYPDFRGRRLREQLIGVSRDTIAKWSEIGWKYIDNRRKYGFYDWYGWRIANWGTKWNAWDCTYGTRVDYEESILSFYTAWGAPVPVIEKLASMFPNVTICHKWSDEGILSNCGWERYTCGKKFESVDTQDEKTQKQIFYHLWGEKWEEDDEDWNDDAETMKL